MTALSRPNAWLHRASPSTTTWAAASGVSSTALKNLPSSGRAPSSGNRSYVAAPQGMDTASAPEPKVVELIAYAATSAKECVSRLKFSYDTHPNEEPVLSPFGPAWRVL